MARAPCRRRQRAEFDMIRSGRSEAQPLRRGRLQRNRQQLAIIRQTGGSSRSPDHRRSRPHDAGPRLTGPTGWGNKFLTHKGGSARPEASIDGNAEILQ